MKNIFTNNGENFLRDEMNICLEDLTNQIMSNAVHHQKKFRDLVEMMINLKLTYEYSSLGSDQNNENKNYIEREFSKFIKKYNITEKEKSYFIFDNLCHAFINIYHASEY